MQVGIVGKGCIGKCLAHLLKRSTVHSPTFLVKPTTFKSLETDGIIDSNECKVTYYPTQSNVSIQTSNINILPIEHNSHPKFDVIVVCTKSFQLIPALHQLQTNNVLQNNPTVILFHNGIISISDIPNFIQSNNIPLIFGTTVHAATAFADDNVFTVRHTGNGLSWLGYRNPFINNDMVNKTILCDIFDTAFAPTTWFDDLEPHLLYKLAINCCINPLTAIYQIRNDEIMRNEKYLSEMRQICTELCDVFRAYFDDIQSKDNIDENSGLTWNKLCNFHQLWDIVNKSLDGVKMNYSSMNRDIYFNRQSEIDQINGYIVELGKKYNVNVQHNEKMVHAIHDIENRYLAK
eukprot:317197_1